MLQALKVLNDLIHLLLLLHSRLHNVPFIIFDSVFEILHFRAKLGKGLQLKLNVLCGSGSLVQISLDSPHIGQSVLNLVINGLSELCNDVSQLVLKLVNIFLREPFFSRSHHWKGL